ncbi:Uncharacterised protein [Mycobacteroides abscessus subsp. abscessus]|nr:Uncharacterised protein [Mycobacteroides abscessus subsp. abscessus]
MAISSSSTAWVRLNARWRTDSAISSDLDWK